MQDWRIREFFNNEEGYETVWKSASRVDVFTETLEEVDYFTKITTYKIEAAHGFAVLLPQNGTRL